MAVKRLATYDELVEALSGGVGGPGTPGADGREVQLQKTATYIQWRYVGDTAWTNLVALADITGPAGTNGAPGAKGDTGAPGATTIDGISGLQDALDAKEPGRSTVTQAEAEAGTGTTVRGWTAVRVKQAIAAYIAANVASIKSTLGIAAVSYLWSSSGVATIATTGAHRVSVAQTLAQARMRTVTAPAGSALTAVLQRFTGGAWANLATLTIADGTVAESVVSVTTTLAVDDLLRLNVTSVGSTTPATGVVVEVYPA